MHNILWLRSPTDSVSSIAPGDLLKDTSDCVNLANILLAPFSKICQQEQTCVAALLEAIVHKVAAPHSTSPARKHVQVANACPTQLLAIAVYIGIDISDTGFVNAKGHDVVELFRRIVLVCARNANDIRRCIESRDRGLAFIRQDRRWLRRAHRGYRIYHKYGVQLETRFKGEWFDQGEDMYEIGLDMWEQQGEGEKGGWMKRVVAALT